MLQSTYDTDADALYLKLSDGTIARSAEIDDGTLVDEDAEGEIVGIEVLRPARNWPLQTILQRYKISELNRKLLQAMFGGAQMRLVPPSHEAYGVTGSVMAS